MRERVRGLDFAAPSAKSSSMRKIERCQGGRALLGRSRITRKAFGLSIGPIETLEVACTCKSIGTNCLVKVHRIILKIRVAINIHRIPLWVALLRPQQRHPETPLQLVIRLLPRAPLAQRLPNLRGRAVARLVPLQPVFATQKGLVVAVRVPDVRDGDAGVAARVPVFGPREVVGEAVVDADVENLFQSFWRNAWEEIGHRATVPFTPSRSLFGAERFRLSVGGVCRRHRPFALVVLVCAQMPAVESEILRRMERRALGPALVFACHFPFTSPQPGFFLAKTPGYQRHPDDNGASMLRLMNSVPICIQRSVVG